MTTRGELEQLSYKELQQKAKQAGISARQKVNVEMFL